MGLLPLFIEGSYIFLPTYMPLYPIAECPDLMADACVCDTLGELIFISLWGRDTAIQQFLARLTLGRDEDGLDQFHIMTSQEETLSASIGNTDRFEKRFTRTYHCTLFGSIINLWLFDKRCIKPDKSNASALAMLPQDSINRPDRLWALVVNTCSLPLLDHWRDTVLEILKSHAMLTRLPIAIGPLEGYQLALDMPFLTEILGSLIRDDALQVFPQHADARNTLQHIR